ncbi:MAG: hypothetical protein WEG36_00195 [Gemmatimonadota bacterium]
MAAKLGLWRLRIGALWLRREALRSIQGWAVLLLLVVAAPSLWELVVVEDSFPLRGLDGLARIGALVVSSLALTLTYAVMVPALLWRERAVQGQREPLRAHPWIFPELFCVQVVSAVGICGLHLLVFHDLLLHGLVTGGAARPGWVLLLHASASLAYYFVVGILVLGAVGFTRMSAPRKAPTLRHQRIFALLFMATFPLFVVVPHLLGEWAPSVLSRIGESAPNALHFLQAPVAILHAATDGSEARIAGWGAVLIAGVMLGTRALWRQSGRVALQGLDAGGEGLPTSYECAFPPRLRGRTSRLRLFWTKDVVLPLRRGPWAYVALHSVLASWVLLGLAGALLGAREASEAAALTGGGLDALLFALAGVLAGLRTLPSLGSEKSTLHLWRPFISPAETFRLKLLVNEGYVLLHAPLYGLMISAGSWLAGVPGPTAIEAVGFALIGGGVMSLFGTGLGFLFPDSRCRGVVLPGASTTGIFLFGAFAIGATGVVTAARVLFSQGTISPLVHAGILATSVLTIASLSGVIVTLALTRLRNGPP